MRQNNYEALLTEEDELKQKVNELKREQAEQEEKAVSVSDYFFY